MSCRELLTERLRAAEVEALCAEFGVESLYDLPAAKFDALCYGEAERVIEELEAERGEPLPGHGEDVSEVPPGYAWAALKEHRCGVSRSALLRWRGLGLGWVTVKKPGDAAPSKVYYCVADVERLKRLGPEKYSMRV